MIKESLNSIDTKNCDIDVVGFDNLLVEHAKKCEAKVIIRGLRAVADFEYEFQMAGMNSKLGPEIGNNFFNGIRKSSVNFCKICERNCIV